MGITIVLVFIIGYLVIIFENKARINKSATALLTGIACWIIYMWSGIDKKFILSQLTYNLADISQIVFFLIGAMTIVELIDSHNGFEIIVNRIRKGKKRNIVILAAFLTFFLSSVLNNLTTSIVMISLIRKIITDKKERLYIAGLIIIATNAGGTWSPIGDITTTMLWIGGCISPFKMIFKLLLPTLINFLIPLFIISYKFRKNDLVDVPESTNQNKTTVFERNFIFFAGIGLLISVPVFKTITNLPPYMGMLFSLGLMWLITEIIHSGKNEEDKNRLSVVYALRKIDITSILFFLGILLAIGALQSNGQLLKLSGLLQEKIGNNFIVVSLLGLLSAVIDNVPLVAGAMGMYNIHFFPIDHQIWEFLAYCAGTGGSILIIGSMAGVAVMGIEKISFSWYLKNISWIALLSYLAGIAVYFIQ